jgi:hypothetical protein
MKVAPLLSQFGSMKHKELKGKLTFVLIHILSPPPNSSDPLELFLHVLSIS